MKNIIIIGKNGNIGFEIYKYLYSRNKIFTDSDIDLKTLISLKFINENNIDFIINCIGSCNNSSLFFNSNFLIPFFVSQELSKIDNLIKKKITFIHLSTIGVIAPFTRFKLNKINIDPYQKLNLKYNAYELSKSCGEYALKQNLLNLKNISTLILQPSNIILERSIFLKKFKIFLFLLPIKVKHNRGIIITPINYLLEHINYIILENKSKSIEVHQVFKRVKINKIFSKYKFISILKFPLPSNLIDYFIRKIPDFYCFSSIKRILILTFII